jgi:hypothetical protein
MQESMWTPELQQTINVNYSKPAAPVALVHQVQYERLLQPRCVTTPPDGAKHLTKQFAAVPAHTQRLLNVLPVAGHTYTQQQQQQIIICGRVSGYVAAVCSCSSHGASVQRPAGRWAHLQPVRQQQQPP